jgi:hypothetical protein
MRHLSQSSCQTLSFPVGMSARPDRETATAYFRLQASGFRNLEALTVELAGRRRVTLGRGVRPCSLFFIILCAYLNFYP